MTLSRTCMDVGRITLDMELLSSFYSREEAMKRMYACCTTTYNGFQAVMTEEMSEKFRGKYSNAMMTIDKEPHN